MKTAILVDGGFYRRGKLKDAYISRKYFVIFDDEMTTNRFLTTE